MIEAEIERSVREDSAEAIVLGCAGMADFIRQLTDGFGLSVINGVDITGWPGGTISAAHSETDLDQTVEAFRESLRMLRAEEAI